MIYDSSQDEMLVYVGIIDTEKWKNKSWDDSSQGSFFFFSVEDAQPTWLEVVVPRETAAERPARHKTCKPPEV